MIIKKVIIYIYIYILHELQIAIQFTNFQRISIKFDLK